ncbi:MAG TPA: hypothetical protein VIK77_09185 [Tissierellaceae bacterium]
MGDVRINERIIKGIKECSEGDKIIENFLIDLIYEEAEHSGKWWKWMDKYEEKIERYVDNWSDANDN